VPVLAEALVRWQHAAGPFWPYVCAAPFLGTGESAELLPRPQAGRSQPVNGSAPAIRWTPHQRALAAALLQDAPPLARARETRGSCRSRGAPSFVRGPGGRGDQGAPWWAGEGCPSAAVGEGRPGLPLLLLDVPPEPVLAVAPLLVAQGWYVVPVIQRWIARPAVLPCRTLLLRLQAGAWRVRRPPEPRGVVLVVDGARRGSTGYPSLAPGRVFDNRYEYQICRFPSTDFLAAHGVRQVRWLTTPPPAPAAPARDLEGRPVGTVVARDLTPYLETLLQAGIAVDVQPWSLPS
jgi:hypothetical protein